jgi:hypothetical protein
MRHFLVARLPELFAAFQREQAGATDASTS